MSKLADGLLELRAAAIEVETAFGRFHADEAAYLELLDAVNHLRVARRRFDRAIKAETKRWSSPAAFDAFIERRLSSPREPVDGASEEGSTSAPPATETRVVSRRSSRAPGAPSRRRHDSVSLELVSSKEEGSRDNDKT